MGKRRARRAESIERRLIRAENMLRLLAIPATKNGELTLSEMDTLAYHTSNIYEELEEKARKANPPIQDAKNRRVS